jgi:hypothetical protein
MHKNKYICIFLFLVPFLIFSQNNYNVPDFTEDKIGTYMPMIFIEKLTETNSYRLAMLVNECYDVICINKNIVYSNLKFHDQYAIVADKVKKFNIFEINGILELIDENGFKYIKISDNINYYMVYREYINNYFFRYLNRFNYSNLIKTDVGFIYNEKLWLINLDVLNYPKDDNFMYYYEKRNGEYIGIQCFEDLIILYELEPDEEDFLASKNKIEILRIQ